MVSGSSDNTIRYEGKDRLGLPAGATIWSVGPLTTPSGMRGRIAKPRLGVL